MVGRLVAWLVEDPPAAPQAFCREVLYECITLEKPHMLLPYLALYTWQQELLGADAHGLQTLSGARPALPAHPHSSDAG